MRLWLPFAAGAGLLILIGSLVGPDWSVPPVDSTQLGYRGTGMELIQDRERQAQLEAANIPPPPPYEADPEGERAGDIYENVQVLGDLSDDQFNQFMASITEWVSPDAGCDYCHNPENLASDEVYTKVVSRRMIQMTQAINANWKDHVGTVGATCYTCHRGQTVPEFVWHLETEPKAMTGIIGYRAEQNVVAKNAGLTSLPQNHLNTYLLNEENIRVHSEVALAAKVDNDSGVMDTEGTYALMMHMSESLGVNCLTCHNSRAFNDWDQSPPQRVTAWHGIRMARDINQNFLVDLTPVFPSNRLGPAGDVLKVSCQTCHQGLQKPLNGISMLQDYVDSLSKVTSDAVPDYSSYVPGETQVLKP